MNMPSVCDINYLYTDMKSNRAGTAFALFQRACTYGAEGGHI